MKQPTALDPILALPDPRERARALTDYLERLEQQAARAREARLDTVAELRAAGATWPELRTLTSLSEQYLRRTVRP